ncbi:[dimethylamine--corrinoid protein] Co-methyltransferase [Candidatus Formimonas warabiya]|uniref:[dimethylamine--corrinoid protein] Co-methyltransferase n=1 Tax=Formimonas warabiya TaxID=1761012 RepID=A0A3G1KUL2_FORW1|nr:[dimethylamine--corrinoid protein] Co-methyltransferase [Candidatus Formimonas warabiya]
MKKYFTRMGDGSAVWMSDEDIRWDLEEGMKDAADRGKIPELTDDEIEQLFEIITHPQKTVSCERGNEAVVTFDAGTLKLPVRAGLPMDRTTTILTHERVFCSDTMELCATDYSYKALKNIVSEEAMAMERAQLNCIIPIFYGAMPNLGLYTKPDGPIDNWSELLPLAKIPEARAAQEEAVEHAVRDMVFIASALYESGADGINFDTIGASGDGDYLAALKAAEILKDKYPGIPIEMGMAGEFVLGMHGQLKYDGVRLAGLYPHQQVKVCEKAGATIFGCVINTNSSMSFAWNLARTVTFAKACVEAADIPVHVNAGMGVGGIPLTNTSPTDATSRASKAIIEIAKADGL